jgi:cytoskeletal protein CcmA (bactofilin family)
MFGRKNIFKDMSLSAQNTSFIHDGLVVKGDTSSNGNLHVEGEIEGDVKCANFSMGEKGRMNGTVTAEKVIIAGTLTGSIKGKSVNLMQGCDVTADISSGSLSVEHGAKYRGKSDYLEEPAEKLVKDNNKDDDSSTEISFDRMPGYLN